MGTYVHKKSCARILIAALSTVAKSQKQPWFPSTEEWLNKVLPAWWVLCLLANWQELPKGTRGSCRCEFKEGIVAESHDGSILPLGTRLSRPMKLQEAGMESHSSSCWRRMVNTATWVLSSRHEHVRSRRSVSICPVHQRIFSAATEPGAHVLLG